MWLLRWDIVALVFVFVEEVVVWDESWPAASILLLPHTRLEEPQLLSRSQSSNCSTTSQEFKEFKLYHRLKTSRNVGLICRRFQIFGQVRFFDFFVFCLYDPLANMIQPSLLVQQAKISTHKSWRYDEKDTTVFEMKKTGSEAQLTQIKNAWKC